MSDIALRAIKTFIQCFFGVFIPELCIVLQEDFPVDMSTAAVIFAPMFCAALAAGLSGAWNLIEKHLSSSVDNVEDECRESLEDTEM